MDKIKNLVNPGSKKDDEVMYGSGVSDDAVHTGTTGTGSGSHTGQGSHFDSNRKTSNDPLSTSTHPTSGHTGLGGTSGKDSLSTSTNPTGSSQYNTSSAGRGTHGLNEPYASRMPGGFDDDAATTASVRSGVPGQSTHTGSNMTGTHDPTLVDKPLSREPGAAGHGTTGTGASISSGLGGSSLSGNDYPDRSVGSSGIGNQPDGQSNLGRDAAIGAGAAGIATGAHHKQESAQRDDYAPETGRSFPLGGSSNTGTGSYVPPGQPGSYSTSGPTTAGPHSSNLANKADPRVDSDLDGSRAVGHSGYGSGTSATPSSTHQGALGHDTAPSASTGAATGGVASGLSSHGPESWGHDHGRHGHQYEGDPRGPGENQGGGPHFVPGPHVTDTANRLDPHVAGSVGSPETTTGSGHHIHRDEKVPLPGSGTGTGLGAYGAERDNNTRTGPSTGAGLGSSSLDTGTGRSSTGPAPNTAGPHKSDMMNKLDPRVDSDLSKQKGSSDAPGSAFGSSTSGTSDPYSSHGTGRHHEQGAALGGTGLAGVAAHEGTKSGDSGLGNTATARADKDHHIARDAGLGAGAGGLAYDADRHHGQPTQATAAPGVSAGSGYDNTRGLPAHDQAGSRLAGSSQEPAATKDHHYGRDAALGAGAGGAAYEAGKHFDKDLSGVARTPQDQLAGSGHQPQAIGTTNTGYNDTGHGHHLDHERQQRGDPVATYSSTGYGNEPSVQDQDRHGHRDKEALAGGAAAGGLAQHEMSKKDEKALEKEHSKEVKRQEKELAKEEKAHEKELAKEEKAHEKDVKAHEKERAKHMAAIEKDQKKHEHEAQKHEHDGEKKKGGLLGFLHRDKPDKELKEEEAARQAALHAGNDRHSSAGTGPESYSDPLAGEHGSQSGVHDTPIGRGITTHDAYGTQEGPNKLHKDPPGNVIGSHGADYQGHGNVS